MLPEGGLRKSAMRLAMAGGLEFGMQLILPVILVRCLDETAFGQYRLIWLLANTALAISPAFLPNSLFYFLPRVDPGRRGTVIGNVLLFMTLAAILTGLVCSGYNPWLQATARHLFFESHGLSALFITLWILASTLDVLPTADGRTRWQSRAIVGMALLRTLLLSAAALTTSSIVWVAGAMLAVASVKLLLMAWYVYPFAVRGTIRCDMRLLRQQIHYSIPFALGNALFQLRGQIDQWVVISLLSPAIYASFSIASVVQPIAALIRQPVCNAMMPRLNAAHARGDRAEIEALIVKSNGSTALLLLPIIGGMLVAAPELVEIVYTSRYQQTAVIMQIYLLGMLTNLFAVGHVLSAIGKGTFAAVNSGCTLLTSALLSVAGIHAFGLPGAAVGGVLTLALGEIWALQVVARALGSSMPRLVPWAALRPVVGGTGCALLLTQLASDHLAIRRFALLATNGAIYVLVFGIVFLAMGGRRQMNLLLGWPAYRNKAAAVPPAELGRVP